MGAKGNDTNKVVIGLGLGQFSSKMRLSSLYSSFQSYFVQKLSMQLFFLIVSHLFPLSFSLVNQEFY